MDNFRDLLIDFLEKFLNLFLVKGGSVETQQLVKVLIFAIALLFFVVFFSIIVKVLKLTIESMRGSPEYVFFIIMTILVFSFTGEFSFWGACTAIFFFLLLGLVYKSITTHKPKPEEKND
jgi:Ca2+/Na+ antiporter